MNQVVIMPLRDTVHNFLFLLSMTDTAGSSTQVHFKLLLFASVGYWLKMKLQAKDNSIA